MTLKNNTVLKTVQIWTIQILDLLGIQGWYSCLKLALTLAQSLA